MRRRRLGLQRLSFGVQLVEVPTGRAQVAERTHDAAVVPAAAHGYFRERVALAALLLLLLKLVVVANAAGAAVGAARRLGRRLLLVHGMARVRVGVVVLVVLGIVVRLPERTGMAGRGQLAHVELAALAGRSCRARERRGASPEGDRQRRRSAEKQRQVIARGSRSPVINAAVALEARAGLLLWLPLFAVLLLLLLLVMRVWALLLLLLL